MVLKRHPARGFLGGLLLSAALTASASAQGKPPAGAAPGGEIEVRGCVHRGPSGCLLLRDEKTGELYHLRGARPPPNIGVAIAALGQTCAECSAFCMPARPFRVTRYAFSDSRCHVRPHAPR